MKIQELKLLVALAEELHFGRAAERIGMAQPQLSDSIRRIESEAGVDIFVRRPRVRLTPGGEVVVAMARRLLAELAEGTAHARAVASGKVGRISLGFSTPAMCSDLPELVRTFMDDNPDVELKLVEGTTGPLRHQLERGELDLVIVREPIWGNGVENIRFARDYINIILPEGHKAARKDMIAPAELADEDMILFPRASAPHYHDRISSWRRDVGLHPRATRETDSWIAVLSMVGAGLGFSLGTDLLGRIGFPGVAYRKLAAEPLDVSFWMNWAPARVSPATERLIGRICELKR